MLGFALLPFGRVSLRGFWFGYVLTFAILALAATTADYFILKDWLPTAVNAPWVEPVNAVFKGPALAAVAILAAWGFVMMIIKRLHDRGFGGLMLVWKALLMAGLGWLAWNAETFIPQPAGTYVSAAAGIILALLALRMLIIVLFLRGQAGENRFGPDPLAKLDLPS